MVGNASQILGSSAMRRSSNVQRRKVKVEVIKRSHLPFSVFSFAPKILYNPFVLLLDYEQRLLKQPLRRIGRLVTQSIQDGLLGSVLHLFSKKSNRHASRLQGPIRSNRRCRMEARRSFEKAKQLEKDMDLEGAIASLEHASELQPENVNYLAMLSKQYTDMSFAPGTSRETARMYNEKALEVAEKIVALKPKDPAGHVARGVCKGRLAYFSDNRTKIELAKEAEESVRTALELNGDSDLGHHLMGRFQYEMAGLNLFCRAFVRVVYGTTLSPGSYQHALEAFEKAHSLRPDRVIHKVLLGKT